MTKSDDARGSGAGAGSGGGKAPGASKGAAVTEDDLRTAGETVSAAPRAAAPASLRRRRGAGQRSQQGSPGATSAPKGCARPKRPLLSREEAPAYIRSPYFSGGYRQCEGHLDALKSLFYGHLDIWDTWTAVFDVFHSTALLLYAMYCTDVWRDGVGTSFDRLVFWLFYGVSWLHAPPSAMYHLFGCAGISEAHFLFYQRLDYIMIFCSSVPLAFCLGAYVFHVAPLPLFLSVIGVVASATHAAVTLRRSLLPSTRIRMMAVLVMFYVMPMLWQVGVDVINGDILAPTCLSALAALVSLGFGAFTYGSKWPECQYHDSPVNSHSLMHVGVNLAYFFEFVFILHAWHNVRHGEAGDMMHAPSWSPAALAQLL